MDTTSVMGEVLALMLKQNPMIQELRLYDDRDTIGIGMDLDDIDTSARIIAFSGEDFLRDALKGTDIVINCGGHSPNPFESYEDLFERNAEDIRRTAIYLTEFNQNAIFCIARPPVESLVPMVHEEYHKAGVKIPETKIVGVVNYACMRANHWIARFTNTNAFNVTCPIIGGATAEAAVAVVSGSNPGKNITNPRVLAAIQDGMAYGEEKVLSVRINEDGGSVAHTPAVGTYRLVNNVLKGLRGDHDAIDCAFLRQEEHLKKFLPYMTSIVMFGRHGVYSTHMPEMVGGEIYRLKHNYSVLRAYIHLGESYVHGLPMPAHKLPCAKPCDVARIKVEQDVTQPLDVKILDPSIYDKCERIRERIDNVKPCDTCQ
ncbi:hypothetical protein HHI36_011691 [Cryptolaemus montrouzieri]|uniref:Malate dehydrogenase, mitochondrial n=1 Tax=Cryptolaemus montrouzieri TaxID=559131 RepID=A0ABD2MME2_9CUCU